MRAEGLIAIVGGVILVIAAAMFIAGAQHCAARNPTDLDEVVAAAPPPQVSTRDGVALTAGSTAWIDGRDTEASPPITLRRVRIWTSTQRTRPACEIEHGRRVNVTAVERSEGRQHARIRLAGCEGWVTSDTFLSSTRQPGAGAWYE